MILNRIISMASFLATKNGCKEEQFFQDFVSLDYIKH